MIGIYKITNLKNGKAYVGQSINIERRWREHCRPSKAYKSLITQAIVEDGKENFSFQVLVECEINELNDLELKFIHQFNTLEPNGYNIATTTNANNRAKNNTADVVILDIISDIKDGVLSFTDIAKKYDINKSTVSRINSGDTHRVLEESYPLRETRNGENTFPVCIDCGERITSHAVRCKRCSDLAKRLVKRPDRELLKELIRCTPFTQIGKQFGVSDKAVSRWCKNYGLPERKKDIKQYSDEEWNLI